MALEDYNSGDFTVNYTEYQSQRDEQIRKNKQLGALLSVLIVATSLIIAMLILYLIYIMYLVVYSRF